MSRYRQRGFSLLELLVALFVIVIVTSLVTLNVSNDGQDIELESKVRALADISVYALDEAQMSANDMGLMLERGAGEDPDQYRYTWWERRDQRWYAPRLNQDIFSEGSFDPEIELQLVLEDLPVQDLSPTEDPNNPVPQVIFYSSGETTPGFIELRERGSGELLWQLEWDLLGRFFLRLKGQPGPDEIEDE